MGTLLVLDSATYARLGQVNPRGPPASASALGLQVLTTVASLLDSLVGLQPFSHIALKMSALGPAQPMKVLVA